MVRDPWAILRFVVAPTVPPSGDFVGTAGRGCSCWRGAPGHWCNLCHVLGSVSGVFSCRRIGVFVISLLDRQLVYTAGVLVLGLWVGISGKGVLILVLSSRLVFLLLCVSVCVCFFVASFACLQFSALELCGAPRFANSSSELASKFPLPLDTRGKFLV